jgi:membrane-bound lytic murein transglycosylase F
VDRAFTLRDDVAIAWAMRPTATVLAARLDTLISTLVVPESETRPTGGDLQAIRARGVLRVAMPNNANPFFFHSGHPMGRQYDFAQQVATEMGVRLEVIEPRKHSDLMGLVIDRHVDAVAPWLSITPERRQRVRFSAPTMFVDEVLIQRSSEGAISRAEDLDGRSIHVRADSSYRTHLGALLARAPGLRIVEVPEEISTHTLVDRVATGEIDLTVADYDILALALASGRGVRGSLLVGSKLARAFAVHPEAGELLSVLNSFVDSKRAAEPRIHQAFVPPNEGDPAMGLARARMEDWRAAMEALPPDLVAAANRACQGSRVDPRLLLAQSAVASGHDPKRVSPAGGRGLLQIRPHVARDLGYGEVDLTHPDHALSVGKAYLESILVALPDDLPRAERLPMALAAFRVGSEHLSDARALARDLGYGADRWKGGVARALRLLERPEYAARARYGYAPGADAVVYAETVMEALASLRVP